MKQPKVLLGPVDLRRKKTFTIKLVLENVVKSGSLFDAVERIDSF